MKPLQSIAMGLVIVVMVARFHGYDALPDPLGWVLVLLGVRALPTQVSHRTSLLALAVLAGVVSAVLWFPGVTDALYDTDASLAWAANLPQLLFAALLCHALAAVAQGAGDARATRWLGLTRTGMLVVAALPIAVFGAGVTSFASTSVVAAGLMAVLLIWLLFAYSGRPWALPTVTQPDAPTTA